MLFLTLDKKYRGMKHVTRFILFAIIFLSVLYALIFHPVYTVAVLATGLVVVGVYDLLQKKHTVLRNFPVIGHLRYILEGLGPEIRQYFVENDIDGKPLNRNQRDYIYSRAKLEHSTHPFGTEHDLQREGVEWTTHSIHPAEEMEGDPRVMIGGKDCKQPYSASVFNISAMSFGALSKNAVMALNKGAQEGGFYHNTGEGSVSPYHLQGGDLVYQVGTGYFGCRDEQGNFDPNQFSKTAGHSQVKMIELKISQGAKPGHGGILPAEKNNEEIAEIRGVKKDTKVISPPGHSAFSDPEGLLRFIQEMRRLSGGKPVGFKLCIGRKDEFEALCQKMKDLELYPDYITVDGAEGGTGAAPIIFSDHVGMPFENALVFVVDTLRKLGIKEHVKVITSGKIVDGFDIFKALCLGADLCNAARSMMLALGCIQALECDKNTCPSGIATDKSSLIRGLVVEDKYKRVANYHREVVKDFKSLFAAAGCQQLEELNRSYIFKQVNNQPVSFTEIYPGY